MAMSAAAVTAISLASTALSTGMGVYQAIGQSKAQQAQMEAQSKQAKYQADIARQNQQLAEEQASAQRREGYENMTAKRQETARLIGRQRAAMGASGASVDVGSNLDLQADTAAQGEMDAISLYHKGQDAGYQTQLQGWNYGQEAAGHEANAAAYASGADKAGSNGWMNAAGTALGGIAAMGSTWGKYQASQDSYTTLWDKVTPETLTMRHPSGKTATIRTR